MSTRATITLTLLSFTALISAQSPVWGQCGGNGWTGPTTCVSGSTCTYQNDYYSQCIPSSSTPTTTQQPTSQQTTPSTTKNQPSNVPTTGLNAIAKAVGKVWFGTAIDDGDFNSGSYLALLANTQEHGQVTPGNAMKWDATESSRNSFSFSRGDRIVSWAQGNGQLVRGHTLVWHNQLPSWVSNGGFSNATLVSVLQNHVNMVASHWKGKVYCWDVVNEIFNEDGSLRSSVFSNTIGPYFPDIAFRAARAADPNAKLFINDYNIEGTGAKSTGVYNIVKRMKSQGVPVDGIGVQSHLVVGQIPSTIQQNFANFASLNVDIHITELDIRMQLPDDSSKQAQQGTDYYNVIKACMAVSRCTAVTVWGSADGHSWIPGTFPGYGDALPWDSNLHPKPAYNGIVRAFRGQ